MNVMRGLGQCAGVGLLFAITFWALDALFQVQHPIPPYDVWLLVTGGAAAIHPDLSFT